MTLLSVNKLCSKRSSTTSNETKADIVGRFTVVTRGNDNNRRKRGGTILLTDLVTHDSLYCRIDLFHHDLVNVAVNITRWNYIHPDYTLKNDANDVFNNMPTTAWIEVYLDDVYPLGNPTTSMLQQLLNADKIANELLASIPDIDLVSIPDLLHPIKRLSQEQQQQQQPIHVLGRVSAKPVRHLERHGTARFYIELVGYRGDTSTVMVFDGDDLMSWYHTFQTDSWHVFMYVVPVDTQLDGQLGRGALAFISGKSRCYRVDADQFERINLGISSLHNAVQKSGEEETAESSQEQQHQFFQPSATLRPAESTSMSTYSATITRVIDPAFGVYELDNQLITCLFHYTDYSLVYPFRLGMQIQISCAHMLAVDTGSAIMQAWEAPAVERGDYKTHVILVGCRRTHIRIVGFPQHVQYPSTTTAAAKKALSLYGRIYKECIETRADFDTLLQKLEMEVALTRKFKTGIPATARLRKICAITTRKVKPKRPFGGSMYMDVFHHDQSCSAVKTRESTVKLNKFPYICDLATFLLEDEERALQLSRHAGATGTSREDQRVDLIMAPYDTAESDMTVMGMVDAMPDGRLYLLDDTGKLPLLILPENSARRRQLQLGDVYQIQRLQLVKEDLDYQEEGGSRVLLDCTYIVCAVDDLKRVGVVESASRTSLMLPEAVDVRKVTGYKRERVELAVDGDETEQQDDAASHPPMLLYVLDIQPPILSHKDEAFELSSHVRAIRYPVVNEEDNSNKKKPEEVHLIFSSRTQSLRFLPQLRAGCWIGLGANIDEFQRVESAKYVPENIKIPTSIALTLVIDLNRHHIFTTSPSRYSIGVTPTTIGSVPTNIKGLIGSAKKQRIYQVKDILPTTTIPQKAKLLVTESDDDDDDDGDTGPSMVEVGHRFFQDTVNVQGVIVSKGFRDQLWRARATIDANARHVFEEFGVGTGQSGRNQLFFRLRQTDGLDTVDIYMDVWNRTYPLGLIPGALVTFYNLVRKRSEHGTVHCQMLPCTSAAVSEQLDPRTETIITEQIPQKKLSDISRKPGSKNNNNNNKTDPSVFKTPCAIKSISFVSMGWVCGECGTGVQKNKCYQLCKTAKRIFTANAVATVSDGTSQARANFDGDGLVFKLLNIQDSRADKIKTAVLEHGKVTYQHFGNDGHDDDDDDDNDNYDHHGNSNSSNNQGGEEEGEQVEVLSGGMTLPKLCQRVMSTGKVFMLFAREIGERLKKDATVMQQLKIRAVTEEDGQPVAVVYRPRIVAVELQLLDPADCAWEMLSKLQQGQQQQHNEQ
ncbi:CST, telomere maintenance, complex subunit CTC1-domain-containing protein [Zychaea mexicana]|uniref:CST, telomere maintenance, complex subunit CTC1-domain-containing protein n=1 Tax=Zychaea mexicana TaxID=64656 RepID=UPI0022FDC295|nr:CST, telomere maintenance, complex subunit CTC1-domain-containing protein [Zychaea mexicana]KAI9495113.1 CST, telomere maintenance, complex subunit CTC1-domain-containing protein [Zychaea mexicana]